MNGSFSWGPKQRSSKSSWPRLRTELACRPPGVLGRGRQWVGRKREERRGTHLGDPRRRRTMGSGGIGAGGSGGVLFRGGGASATDFLHMMHKVHWRNSSRKTEWNAKHMLHKQTMKTFCTSNNRSKEDETEPEGGRPLLLCRGRRRPRLRRVGPAAAAVCSVAGALRRPFGPSRRAAASRHPAVAGLACAPSRRGGGRGRAAGARQGGRPRGSRRPKGGGRRRKEGAGRPAELAVAAEPPRSSRPAEL